MSTQRFSLRPYQREAIQAVVDARRRGVKRILVCLPTGAGKTVIFSELARVARRQVLVLAHRRELVQQAVDKLERALQGEKVVSVEQGARRAGADARVVVCSIRSLRDERLAALAGGRDIGLIIYDECHHAAAEDNLRVLRQIGVFEPDWPGTLLGFTATTYRGDGQGLDTVFEEIAYSRGILEMIRDGYLAPLRGYRVATEADLRSITGGGGGGDLRVDDLEEAVDIENRNALVARSIQELARDRRTLAFCVTVKHARNLARALRHVGIPAAPIWGAMHPEDRVRVLAAFRAARYMALTNVGVLTEGFDDPGVSCIAMARPTRSSGLYAQMVGRGTRLFPGKTDCLVLDFVDLSSVSLVNLPTLFGMPAEVDLAGEDVSEAESTWRQLVLEHPDFEVDPGSITLAEIRERAEAFDPLTMDLDPEVVAISESAWVSLGARGLALHYQRRGRLLECLVLKRGARGRKYVVIMDGREVARFSRIEQAVEAVDYEIGRLGPRVWESAQPFAAWRLDPPPPELAARLKRRVATWGDAARLATWIAHGPGRA